MSLRTGCVLLSLLLATALSACRSSEANVQRLTLTGSSSVAPLAAEIARRFEESHPGTRVEVQTGGSSRGINDARNGNADIGMVSRALKTTESDLRAHAIALDGIGLILHRSNPVAQLSEDNIRAIFRGRLQNWMGVGGRDAPVTVVNKAEGRSTLELFLQHFGLQSHEVQASVVIGDNEQGIKTVAGNPDAIGYVSIGAAEYAIGQGVALKLLPLGGVPASTANIRDGLFPLARPLNLITRGDPDPLSADFIAYARSDAVADLVSGLYLVQPD